MSGCLWPTITELRRSAPGGRKEGDESFVARVNGDMCSVLTVVRCGDFDLYRVMVPRSLSTGKRVGGLFLEGRLTRMVERIESEEERLAWLARKSMNPIRPTTYAFVCDDCDPRASREVKTIGHPRPDLCDACGKIKESAELVGVGDIADGVTRGRAMRGHELRQDLLVKTEAIPGGPVAGFSGRRWKDAEPECGEVQP